MALPRFYAPLRPDLHNFLFAAVGEERNGIPLSMMSALAQLDLDPWEEAGRLASLATQEAVERLTALILRLPGLRRPSSEARQIAVGLIDVLPTHNGGAKPSEEEARRRKPPTKHHAHQQYLLRTKGPESKERRSRSNPKQFVHRVF